MAEITIPGMFITGDHASRPAANAVGSGSLYACSDHIKVYQSDGASWSDWFDPTSLSAGGTPSTPKMLVPTTGVVLAGTQNFAVANRCIRVPVYVPASVEITGVWFRVGTAAGNISVALYDWAGNRLATSGSVACPSSGMASVSFSAAYTAAEGWYWLALSESSTSATFGTVNASGNNAFTAEYMETAHPAPDPFTRAGVDTRAPALLGLVTGGWAP